MILDDSKKVAGKGEADMFTVVCYNILCDKYATANQYGYAASWALNWDYRKELILQQLIDAKADIICLQEVDADSFDEYFLERLKMEEYAGVHQPKSRAKTMTETERRKVDGCATFFNTSK